MAVLAVAMFAVAGGARAASGDPAPSSVFDDIRALQAQSEAREADLNHRLEDVAVMLEEMRRLTFEINLRIAKLKHGEFERDCKKAVGELASIDNGLAKIAAMDSDARALCQDLKADNAEGQAICSERLSELSTRRGEFEQSRQLLLTACPSIDMKGSKP